MFRQSNIDPKAYIDLITGCTFYLSSLGMTFLRNWRNVGIDLMSDGSLGDPVEELPKIPLDVEGALRELSSIRPSQAIEIDDWVGDKVRTLLSPFTVANDRFLISSESIVHLEKILKIIHSVEDLSVTQFRTPDVDYMEDLLVRCRGKIFEVTCRGLHSDQYDL